MVCSLTKAETMVVCESDLMRAGHAGRLVDLAVVGIGLSPPVQLDVDERVEV